LVLPHIRALLEIAGEFSGVLFRVGQNIYKKLTGELIVIFHHKYAKIKE